MTNFNINLHDHLKEVSTAEEQQQLKDLLEFEAKFLPTPSQCRKIIKGFKPIKQLTTWATFIEMEYLTKIGLHHRRWYYRLSQSILSDSEYDHIESRISELADNFPELYPHNHPFRQVGY
ncbi:DNA ligase [Candidatus Liberibacter solanacearum]|uniref:DNA ligase n=1 Tax=Candidatus Liberibacter solanacearum TaxID=556287 RepID=UPI00387DCBB4